MRRSLFAVLALASLIPTIALADNNDDCVEGDKDVDGPASRQRGRYPGAVQGLTPARSSRRGRFTVHGQVFAFRG